MYSQLTYIAQFKQPVTEKELCKLIFFVDQRLLLEYGSSSSAPNLKRRDR